MVATIVLNSSNLINLNNGNNTFVYPFPNSVSFPHHEIAVQSVSMYYAWANISSALGNNTFIYNMNTPTATPVVITIPDGLYEIATINEYLQSVFIANGDYLFNGTNNVYYAELVVNPTLYAVQVNTFPIPQVLPTPAPPALPWSAPVGWEFATNATTQPTLTFPPNFNLIIGFPPNFATLGNGTGSNYSVVSTTAPQVQPNPNVYLAISNIANPYAVPSSILYAIAPNVDFGSQIVEVPPQFAFNTLLAGTYAEIRLTILGSNLQPLPILDPNMTILLAIRNKKEGLDILSTALNGGK
jgi:hypothetical protein